MATRNVAMTVTFVAWDTSANTGKTGDASNIAVKWIKDGTVETLDTNTVTEVDATNCPGVYKVAISAAEANCNIGMLAGKSTTSDIVVLPISIQFERLPDAAPASNGGLPTVDANNHVNGVQDTLSVNVTQIEGSDATDQINAACDAAIETYGLDHLVSASVAGSDVADNSIVAKLVSKESTADWDDYVNTTESLQALRDRGDSAWTTGGGGGGGASAADIADAVWDEAASGHASSGTFGKYLADVLADTNELQTDWANGGRLDLIIDATLAATNELQTDWANGGRLDLIIDGILADTAEIGSAGAGLSAIPWNSSWDAEVQSECTDALNAYDPPTKAEMDAMWTTAQTEAYASDGAAATPAQLLYMIYCAVGEFAVSGTTITGKKLDGSTTAMTWTINDASNPTSRTRAS